MIKKNPHSYYEASLKSHSNGVLRDFNDVLRYKHELNLKRQKQKNLYILFILLIYIFFAIIMIIFIFNRNPLKIGLFEPKTKTENLQNQINDLNFKYTRLENSLNNNKADNNLQILNMRMGQLEKDQANIKETILIDADKAITMTLLKHDLNEEQKKVTNIENGYTKLNDKIDNIILFALIIPIIGFIIKLILNSVLKKETFNE